MIGPRALVFRVDMLSGVLHDAEWHRTFRFFFWVFWL